MLLCIVNPQESRREPESNAHACLFRAEIGAEERQDLIGKEKTAEALSGIRKKHKKTAASRCFFASLISRGNGRRNGGLAHAHVHARRRYALRCGHDGGIGRCRHGRESLPKRL